MARVKRKKVENSVERRMATGMIVSTRALREIQTLYNEDLVEIPYVRRIANWCLEYFSRYQRAPGKHIQDIFNSQVRKGMDEDEADLISDFLDEISEEYARADHFNVPYLLDEVEERLKAISLQHLAEDIQAHLSNGSTLEAEGLLGQYDRISRPSSNGVNPLDDPEVVQAAFESRAEPLFTLPGAAGDLLNDQLVRGGFLGFMGKAKIGKTAMLLEMVHRSLLHRNNTAFFSAGDETQEDMTVRHHVRLAGKSNQGRYCGKLWVPVLDCEYNQDNTCNRKHREGDTGLEGATSMEDAPDDYKPCSYCAKHDRPRFRGAMWYRRRDPVTPLTWREGLKIGQRFMKRLKGRQFKLVTTPNSTLTVQDIEAHLDAWEHFDGWVPDVIVIDYADIMAPEPEDRRKDTRDQQNGTWKALRRLSQKRHVLVITATQADAESYDTARLKLKNFSECRQKYDHVTGMLGLNQTDEEKRRGIMRVGWMLLRHGEFDPSRMTVLLQCLQQGRPLIGSFPLRFKKKDKKA